jgi:hypothetical protein
LWASGRTCYPSVMKRILHDVSPRLVVFYLVLFPGALIAGDDAPTISRLAQLDAYWAEVSRSVREGDFEGYQATCHERGVLVSGSKESSIPLSKALARWKQGFLDTKSGKIKADVKFRFSQRFGDATTAHETGIFLYSTVNSEGEASQEYVHFQALLIKEKGQWKIFMEYQKSKGTLAEWNALAAR